MNTVQRRFVDAVSLARLNTECDSEVHAYPTENATASTT